MSSMTLSLVQQLVDRLSVGEQAQLLAYLAPKVAGIVTSAEAAPSESTTWDEFFAQGEALLADSSDQSMTEAVTTMRR